jgi:hypothetical protein
MKNIPLIFAFLISIAANAQESFKFPQDCLGNYTGTMFIEYAGRGIVDTAEVNLEFSETDKPDQWNYFNITENERFGKVEKLYTLIANDSINGLYHLDEKNGLIIDHSNMGRKLYSTFEVSGSLIFYQLECVDNETLYYEIATSNINRPKTTKIPAEEAGGTEFIVNSFLPFTRQYVTLKKVEK